MLYIANRLGNANQNHNEISLHTCQNGYHQKRTQITNVVKDVEKREPSYSVGGDVNWSSHCPVWRFLKKLKIELPYNPAIPLLGIYLKTRNKNTNSKRYVHPSVHSSIIYNCQDTEAPCVHQQMNA